MRFICLQTYLSVTFGCFKRRSDVASLSSLFYCLTFTSVSPPPPPGAGWASNAPPLSLLDASVTTFCNHMLQLLAVRMRVRSEGGVCGDSTRAVQRHGPHVARGAGSKGVGGDGPDGVQTSIAKL
jgi:hypothetical protein